MSNNEKNNKNIFKHLKQSRNPASSLGFIKEPL